MARGGFEISGASSNRRSINALDLYSSLVIHLSFLISLRRKASAVKARCPSCPKGDTKRPSHYSRSLDYQLSLVVVTPFGPLLRSSARHIRALVVEGTLHNSPATIGSSY
jgi:hypothetical protein